MMMKSSAREKFHWWRNPEYPEETTDLMKLSHIQPQPSQESDHSGVKLADLRCQQHNALVHSATESPCGDNEDDETHHQHTLPYSFTKGSNGYFMCHTA